MSVETRTGERGGMVYVQAAGGAPRQVLEQVEELLQALGASKSNLLTARALLSDKDLFAEYHAAWNEWLGTRRRPLHAWRLADPRPPCTS